MNGWKTEAGYELSDMCPNWVLVSEGTLAGSWVEGLWDDQQKKCSFANSSLHSPEVLSVDYAEVDFNPREIRLTGWVYPENHETHYHFEYGATTAYGTVLPAPDANAGSGFTSVRASQTLTGMAEGVYHYRLVATNSTGTSYGEDRIVVSPGCYTKEIPMSPGGKGQWGEGVSCVAGQVCIAVGQYWNSTAGRYEAMGARWEGGEWTLLSPVSPSGYESSLSAASCTASTACTAVGTKSHWPPPEEQEASSLIERWDGSSWTVQSAPHPWRVLSFEAYRVPRP